MAAPAGGPPRAPGDRTRRGAVAAVLLVVGAVLCWTPADFVAPQREAWRRRRPSTSPVQAHAVAASAVDAELAVWERAHVRRRTKYDDFVGWRPLGAEESDDVLRQDFMLISSLLDKPPVQFSAYLPAEDHEKRKQALMSIAREPEFDGKYYQQMAFAFTINRVMEVVRDYSFGYTKEVSVALRRLATLAPNAASQGGLLTELTLLTQTLLITLRKDRCSNDPEDLFTRSKTNALLKNPSVCADTVAQIFKSCSELGYVPSEPVQDALVQKFLEHQESVETPALLMVLQSLPKVFPDRAPPVLLQALEARAALKLGLVADYAGFGEHDFHGQDDFERHRPPNYSAPLTATDYADIMQAFSGLDHRPGEALLRVPPEWEALPT